MFMSHIENVTTGVLNRPMRIMECRSDGFRQIASAASNN